MTALWAHRRLTLSLVLCLVVTLGVAVALRAYGPGILQDLSPTPTPHQTYTFSLDVVPHDAAVPALQLGKPTAFEWVTTPLPVLSGGHVPMASRPFPVHCTLTLYGPYPSMDDLTKATNTPGTDGIAPSGTPAFTTPPLNMTDWDTTSHQVEFALPTTLHVGYYQTDSECLYDRDQSTSGIGFPIQIDA